MKVRFCGAYSVFMLPSVIPSRLQLVLCVKEGQTDYRLKWALLQSQEVHVLPLKIRNNRQCTC